MVKTIKIDIYQERIYFVTLLWFLKQITCILYFQLYIASIV